VGADLTAPYVALGLERSALWATTATSAAGTSQVKTSTAISRNRFNSRSFVRKRAHPCALHRLDLRIAAQPHRLPTLLSGGRDSLSLAGLRESHRGRRGAFAACARKSTLELEGSLLERGLELARVFRRAPASRPL